jgi:hypothetical protein
VIEYIERSMSGMPPDGQHPDIDRTPTVGRERRSVNEMTRYERRQFFERLVQLRALYRLRGPDDSVAVMPIDAAIEYGEFLLTDEPGLAEAVASDRSERLGSMPPGSVS